LKKQLETPLMGVPSGRYFRIRFPVELDFATRFSIGAVRGRLVSSVSGVPVFLVFWCRSSFPREFAFRG
jgi:hypothetical protein